MRLVGYGDMVGHGGIGGIEGLVGLVDWWDMVGLRD